MQGSGKGTLGKQVAQKFGMKIFETGAALRALSQEDSDLGRKVKEIIEAGHLVSNEVVMEIVEDFMANLENPEQGILFDGIPRKVVQAETLNALLEKNGRKFTGVLLEIAKETALTRLTTRRVCVKCKQVFPASFKGDECESCGGELVTRKDDNPEAIQTRLDAFERETVPAIELYKDNMITLDGEPSIDEVAEAAISALEPVMNA